MSRIDRKELEGKVLQTSEPPLAAPSPEAPPVTRVLADPMGLVREYALEVARLSNARPVVPATKGQMRRLLRMAIELATD